MNKFKSTPKPDQSNSIDRSQLGKLNSWLQDPILYPFNATLNFKTKNFAPAGIRYAVYIKGKFTQRFFLPNYLSGTGQKRSRLKHW